MTTSPEPEPPVSMLMHARWWASKGVPVLPLNYPVERGGALVCSCGGDCGSNAAKHPLATLVRNGLNDATTDIGVIDSWWERYPHANLGGRTGVVFDLLDIDSAEGMARYGELVEEIGTPENFGMAQSGRDGVGLHLYAAPGGMKALQQGKTAPAGIDVKGRGGYAVLPPSRHISGRRYAILTNTFDDGVLAGTVSWEAFYRRLEVRPQIAPRTPRNPVVLDAAAADAYGAAVLRRALSLIETASSGNRWQTVATEAIPLVARGVDGGCIDRDSGVRELEEAARSIGLDRREIRRIGPLVDDMIAKGIRNPIHPKDAAAQIGDLIASPAGPAPSVARPATLASNGSGAKSSDGSADTEGGDSDDYGGDDSDDHDNAYTGDPRTDPWEPPWPLRYPTPPFPIEVLDWIGPEVAELADRLQCSVDIVAMMTLAAVSATIRGRIRAEVVPGWQEPLNLYVAVIAEPGETKSPALERIIAPLEEMERQAKERIASLIISRRFDREVAEQHAKKLRDNALQIRDERERLNALDQAKQAVLDAEEIVVPADPTYLAGEMTAEALVAMLAEQNGVLAHLSAEGALLDTIVGGRYSKGVANLSGLLMAHDGREALKVHRRAAPDLVVRRPCLTIGLAVQPDVLRKLGENDAAVGRGLAARFLFSIPNSLVGHRDRRLRRSSEGFRGFWALLQAIEARAAGSGGDGPGFGDIGHTIARNTSSSGGPDRWRVAGTPVASPPSRAQGFGDIGHTIPGKSSGSGAGSQGGHGDHAEGFGHIGHTALKISFGESSSSLLEAHLHDLEARRPAGTGDLSDVAAWSNKLDGQLVRLAAILQLIKDCAPERASGDPGTLTTGSGAQNPRNPGGEIGVDAVAAARILVDYLIAHAVEAHAIMNGTEGGPALSLAKQLLDWIRGREAAEFTARDAERSLRNRVAFRDPEALQTALSTLTRLGWLRLVPREPGKPGRPSLRFVVHPDVFTSS